jgi:hypothetical protein
LLAAAYDIVRPLANGQRWEFISLTSSATSDACNFTTAVPFQDDLIILDLTYKMLTA